MNLSKKRTCNNCKAWMNHDSCRVYCELGFEIKTETYPLGHPNSPLLLIKSTPQEPCPKPLTGNQWLEARKHYMKHMVL